MDPTTALAEEVLAWRAASDPAWATEVGLRGQDHRLRASGLRAHVEALEACEALLARAEALPPSVARDALASFLATERVELARVRGWARDPDLARELFDHVLALLLAAHLDDAERADALASRLLASGAFFREGWDRYDPADVPRAWVEAARETLDGAPDFLVAVGAVGALASVPDATRARLAEGLALAQRALAEHRAWLDALHARAAGRIAVGREALVDVLAARRIDASPEEVARMGDEAAARFRRELEEAARTVVAEAGLAPARDVVAQARDIVRADHPATFAEVLAFHEATIRELRELVVSRGLARVPDVPLVLVETPAFLRHLVPFAAYVQPARFASPRRGTYLVTPKVDLAAFARADVRNTVAHEAYPGHHLQLAVAAERADLASFLADAPDLAEGWALYAESLVARHGANASPADRFVRARDALWRAVRMPVDVGLATGALTPEQAVARLVHEVGLAVEEAEAEVLWYSQSPGYALSYMWGRLVLERLRDGALAGGMPEREFHDRLLEAGSVPVALLRFS